jgi:protein tyrosine/serine phosphatase
MKPMVSLWCLLLLMPQPSVLCAEPVPCTADITAEMDEGDGLINFGRVSEELWRSGQPIKKGQADGYRRLQQLGVKTIIDLRTLNGMEFQNIADLNRGTPEISRRIYYIHLPINPFSTDVDYLNQRLETIMKAIRNSPKPVLVHCRYGQDRTGFVVAVYQMLYCGFTYEKALKSMELCHYRPHLGAKHFTKFLDWWVRFRLPVLKDQAK